MSIQDEIIQTAETIVQKYISEIKSQSSSDVGSVVTEIKNGKYKVEINGSNHWLKDGIGLNLTVGTQVWVRIVGNEMYIASRK